MLRLTAQRAGSGREAAGAMPLLNAALAGGEWAGYVRAAAYGHTVGGPVGLAQVACDDGVTGQWLKEGDFRVRTPEGEVPARLQIAPPYDPQRLRILDR